MHLRSHQRSQQRLRRVFWNVAAFLSVGVALFSYRYLPGVGPLAPNIMGNLLRRPWLYVHILGAATALLVGPFQFLAKLRLGPRRLHRTLGRVYVCASLIGGTGGFVAAFGSTAGPSATVGFAVLAVFWIFATLAGFQAARQRRFQEHAQWMIRSFAMTFAAVTLRLYLPLFPLLGLSFMGGYRIDAYVSWIPNLILAELFIRRGLLFRTGVASSTG